MVYKINKEEVENNMTKNKNKDLEKNSSLFESEIITETEIETEESTNPTNLENEQNTLTEVFDNGDDKLFDEEVNVEKEGVVELSYTTISTNTYPQNTSKSKTYKVILVKENSYILDIDGNGSGPYPKTPSTQNIKIGDEITLQNEE